MQRVETLDQQVQTMGKTVETMGQKINRDQAVIEKLTHEIAQLKRLKYFQPAYQARMPDCLPRVVCAETCRCAVPSPAVGQPQKLA